LIVALILCFLQYKYKIVGFVLSILAFFTAYTLLGEYSLGGVVKLYLIIITTMLGFYKIKFKSSINLNYILTFFLFINVFVMTFMVFDTPLSNYIYNNVQSNIFLTVMLFIIALGTPFISIVGKNIILTKKWMNVNVYIILYSVILGLLHIYHTAFKRYWKNIYLLALIIPLLSHFINNKWAETRGLMLCLTILFEVIVNNYGI
jgi:hypothetical protein